MLIEHVSFGQIIIDGEAYGDVLIFDSQIKPRDRERLKQLYGTSHTVGTEEAAELFKSQPDYLIIGTGQYGSLQVPQKIKELAKQRQVRLIIKKTPEVAADFNSLWHKGQKVHALIHTTC